MSVSLKRIKGPKKPMTEVPAKDFVGRNGFGTIPIPHKDWSDRIAATQVVLNVIESGRLPKDSEPLQQSLSMVKGMFSRIYVGDCYDWFTTSKFLGHPSGEVSKAISTSIAVLKGAIREQNVDLFNEAVERINADYGNEMLENYLDMTVRNGHPVREEGWAYVLWSSSERDVVHVGAAGGEVEEVIKRLNDENPDHHPYGVLAAWLVHEPLAAYNDIHAALDRYAMGDGFFRVNFGIARDTVHKLLKDTDNFALSPWHDHEAESAPSAPQMKMAG
ncbi:hypothetical protein [Rhizobium sp. BK176]|uniref:hypothetical protein n=1 Tax=Rhizobium sp. BK176 TaxID=2587071 RepID=UPI002167584B|nr:hypothetical protein [Rhizobium sp. BK176]MCS4089160.1 hypothetical protein [Rhizobium sp. BK176]